MRDYQREFIDFAITTGAIRFGEFTLKSGRVSPYFFNAGQFNTGHRLGRLGQYYAQTIIDSGIKFDMLFGPAYKGIPLATATAIALSGHVDRDIPFAFDRKEKKQHGEGGRIVGHPLEGRVLIIDDVISSGISVNGAVDIIRDANARPGGVVIAVDRQEKGSADTSAVQEVESTHNLSVTSIIKLETLIQYLKDSDGLEQHLQPIEAYRSKYGV
ncbi:MAG: orotate phosphoribosyltransferase [Acidiferrobacterales bacterium]